MTILVLFFALLAPGFAVLAVFENKRLGLLGLWTTAPTAFVISLAASTRPFRMRLKRGSDSL